MNSGVTITYGDSKPLSELERLIDLRVRRLGEAASDSAVATAIDVMRSLRALTRRAKESRKPNATVELRSQYIPSIHIDGNRKIPCLRTPGGERVKPGMPVVWDAAFTRGYPVTALHVYYVSPELPRLRPYLCVAPSAEIALQKETARARGRIKSRGGLARNIYSLAMGSISTRGNAMEGAADAQSLAQKYLGIKQGKSGDAYSLEIHDRLNYAILALKGGKAAVDTALMRAANKINGMIKQKLALRGDLAQDLDTPFPDVKRRQ